MGVGSAAGMLFVIAMDNWTCPRLWNLWNPGQLRRNCDRGFGLRPHLPKRLLSTPCTIGRGLPSSVQFHHCWVGSFDGSSKSILGQGKWPGAAILARQANSRLKPIALLLMILISKVSMASRSILSVFFWGRIRRQTNLLAFHDQRHP